MAREKKSRYQDIDKNDVNTTERNVNGCRRSFEDFVSMSTQGLVDDNGGTVVRNEGDSPETTSLVFQGMSVTCLGESCSVCDKKGCHSSDNASEAFAFFLNKSDVAMKWHCTYVIRESTIPERGLLLSDS